ncbi:MAG: hypothetical protein DMF41_13225 [Verrucomicrobia bacterium]|nr:MAG: hypothetical protein DMF41_13225 [Verrucomicrobiota bacterium]
MHIDLNSLFSGLGGVLIGAWITYKLQHRLLDKQLAAAKASQDAFMAVLTEFRNMLNTRFGMLISEVGNAAYAAEQRQKENK